jgi:hypothetical protein
MLIDRPLNACHSAFDIFQLVVEILNGTIIQRGRLVDIGHIGFKTQENVEANNDDGDNAADRDTHQGNQEIEPPSYGANRCHGNYMLRAI